MLVGGFLAGLLLISAIQVTLYAKYKRGDYTLYKPESNLTSESMLTFPNVLFVSVYNVPNATVNFSDAARVEKDEESSIKYVQKGDTLLITGSGGAHHRDANYPVALDLPYNATLSVFNSSLSFRTGSQTTESNPVINLRKSEAWFLGTKNPLRFGNVRVIATDSSTAAFRGNTQVNSLDVQLSNSSIVYTGGDVGRLSILTDTVSRISLEARLLAKANIRTITPK